MAATSFPKGEIKILLLENIHPVASEAFTKDGFLVETAADARAFQPRTPERLAYFTPTTLSVDDMRAIERAIRVQLGLPPS